MPALIDFERSVIVEAELTASAGQSPLPRRRGLLRELREWAEGRNPHAAVNCGLFLAHCRAFEAPRVLVVGGGVRGAGTDALYVDPAVRVVATDVYVSAETEIVADGHSLPFADGSFHGVWIQAVLEHVASPSEVVGEIRRVLVDGGVVYAETPFLQPVHERAFDFTRFTRSGHRWLFAEFAELRAGTIGGPAESLLWSIRYLARGLFRSEKVGSAFVLLFFWLRVLDRLVPASYRADSATGVFFLGTKRDLAMTPAELVAYFPGARGSPQAHEFRFRARRTIRDRLTKKAPL